MTEETFSSFAKTLATLQKLTKIEAGIAGIVNASKVPHAETRKFLRGETEQQCMNTPLFQFLKRSLLDVGLGAMEIIEVAQFKHIYTISDNPIAALYPEIKGKKTCYVTADAISQFYAKDLGLVNTVEEIECQNESKQKCAFEVNLQPLSVYQIVLDRTDRKAVEYCASHPSIDKDEIADYLLVELEEVEYRLDTLKRYHLLNTEGSLTKIGLTYSKYGTGPLSEKEEEFPPPWEKMSHLASSVAGAESFAEAFTEATVPSSIWEVDEEEIVNLAEEAKKSKSFAELLSRHLKKEDEGGV